MATTVPSRVGNASVTLTNFEFVLRSTQSKETDKT